MRSRSSFYVFLIKKLWNELHAVTQRHDWMERVGNVTADPASYEMPSQSWAPSAKLP